MAVGVLLRQVHQQSGRLAEVGCDIRGRRLNENLKHFLLHSTFSFCNGTTPGCPGFASRLQVPESRDVQLLVVRKEGATAMAQLIRERVRKHAVVGMLLQQVDQQSSCLAAAGWGKKFGEAKMA